MRTGQWLILFSALGLTPASADDSVEEQVRCAEIRFSLSVENQDPAAFAASIDPDARFVGGAVQRGPAEIAAAWAPFFESGGPSIMWRPQFVEVLASGDLALSRGPYRLQSSGENGELVEGWGTFNSVWQRNANGGWLVVFDAGGPPNEDPPEAVRALMDDDGANCIPTASEHG